MELVTCTCFQSNDLDDSPRCMALFQAVAGAYCVYLYLLRDSPVRAHSLSLKSYKFMAVPWFEQAIHLCELRLPPRIGQGTCSCFVLGEHHLFFSGDGHANRSLQLWKFWIYGCIQAVFFVCYSRKTYQVESVCFSLCIISNRHSFERNVLESFQGADNRLPQEQECKAWDTDLPSHYLRYCISQIPSLGAVSTWLVHSYPVH